MKNSFDDWVTGTNVVKLFLRILIIFFALYLGYLLLDIMWHGFYVDDGVQIICYTLITWLLCYISANLKNL